MLLIVLSISLAGEPVITTRQYTSAAQCQAAKKKVINRLGRQLWKGCVK